MNLWVIAAVAALGASVPIFVFILAQARAMDAIKHRIETLEADIDAFPLAAINAHGEVYRTHIKRTYEA